ncbi:endonuclease V-domain-containing protein [Dichotomocladium elegans]|nr:endonuclease V-domain-containing protein [Dichotomocladium elegans]
MSTEEYDANPSAQQRHEWEKQQNMLNKQIILTNERLTFNPDTLENLRYIAGVDLSFPENDNERALACLSILSWPGLEVVHTAFKETRLKLPYIAGFLAFREVAPLHDLLRETHPAIYPQVVLVDGNGRLHPRTCGVACHLGLLADTPTIGVAKNFLVIENELDMKSVKKQCGQVLHKRGDTLVLRGKTSGTVYGAALRATDAAPNPIFVSQGHRVSLQTAIKIVLACCKYRIPEPIRRADQDSRCFIKNMLATK